MQAGAAFRYELLWAIALGTICHRVSRRDDRTARRRQPPHGRCRGPQAVRIQGPDVAAPGADRCRSARARVGNRRRIAGARARDRGTRFRVWVVPVAVLVWALLWFATFGAIEHSVAVLGLVTLSFSFAAWRLGPDWTAVPPWLRAAPSGDRRGAVRLSRRRHPRRDDQPIPVLVLLVRGGRRGLARRGSHAEPFRRSVRHGIRQPRRQCR